MVQKNINLKYIFFNNFLMKYNIINHLLIIFFLGKQNLIFNRIKQIFKVFLKIIHNKICKFNHKIKIIRII